MNRRDFLKALTAFSAAVSMRPVDLLALPNSTIPNNKNAHRPRFYPNHKYGNSVLISDSAAIPSAVEFLDNDIMRNIPRRYWGSIEYGFKERGGYDGVESVYWLYEPKNRNTLAASRAGVVALGDGN